MEQTAFIANPTRLLIAAAAGITVLLILIIKFKLHPVISMMIAAIIIGVGAGMPLAMISDTVEKGVGKTLQGIALLVGLGSMFGGILEVSDGAQRIAQTLLLLSGLASGYAFVPPSAGSVLVADSLGVNLGVMIMVGIPMAFDMYDSCWCNVGKISQFDGVEVCVNDSEKDKVYKKLKQMNLLR